MQKRLFVFSITCWLTLGAVWAQVDVNLFNYWQYYSDVENSLYQHFCGVAFDQLHQRKEQIDQLVTREDWEQRQALVRSKLNKVVGSFTEKTPLNARVTGVVKRDGYRIEKIIYESQPGYYVTGAIYIPDGVKRNAPAIFYVCGHSVEGFRAETYQHIIINLVKKNFVVFTIDPMGQGERFEYWEEAKGASRYPVPDHEHSYAGAQCLISGYSIGKQFIWDAIRGIDYMLTRKEIDPARIGMTGRSGGGNITAYVGAIDNRIWAAAPECYITSYAEIYKSIGPQCAEQNLYQMIKEGLDHADFLEVRAPRPTMVISTTRDFFSIQGTRDSYQEARRMYEAFDVGENMVMVEDDSIHRSTQKNREAMYAFFQEHLNNPGNSEDVKVAIPDLKELQNTETGQLVTSLRGETICSLNQKKWSNQMTALQKSRQQMESHLEEIPDHVKRISGFEYPLDFGDAVFSGRLNSPEYTMEKYLIDGSGDYKLPVVLLRPASTPDQEKLILLLDTKGMDHAVNQDSLVIRLVKEGYAALLCDLPGIGSMGPGYLEGDSFINSVSYNQWFASVLTGKSFVGLRAEDVIRVIHFARTDLDGYDFHSILGVGNIGSEVLHVATFDREINNIALINPFLSFEEIISTQFYDPKLIPHTIAGAIENYDLPDLMARFCPGDLLMVNPIVADGKPARDPKIKENLQFPRRVYNIKEASKHFLLKSGIAIENIQDEVLHWMSTNNVH